MAGIALAADVSQTLDHYLGPPLAATGILGQTFQMDCDGLNRVEVTLGTFNEQHDQWAGQLGSLQQLEANFAFGAYCNLSLG